MEAWPRLTLAENGPTTVVFTASMVSNDLSGLLEDDFNFKLCLRKLSLTEQLKVCNIRHNWVKALSLSLFSRVVLNYALYSAEVSQSFAPFKTLPLVLNEYGKPGLAVEGRTHIEYNSSSSNDIMAVVVQFNGTTPVGIDLSYETQSSISETRFVEQFEGIFSKLELTQLDAVENLLERYVFFNQLWTLKEAFTKFVGCGLNVDLSAFHFNVGPNRPLLVDPIMSDTGHYKRLQLTWQRDIEADFQNLDDKFKNRIADLPVNCQSSILKAGPLLPVTISIVSQQSMENVDVLEIDLGAVIRSIIDE